MYQESCFFMIWQIILDLRSGDGGFSTPKNSTLAASNSQGVELSEINVRSRVFWSLGDKVCLYVICSEVVWGYCS